MVRPLPGPEGEVMFYYGLFLPAGQCFYRSPPGGASGGVPWWRPMPIAHAQLDLIYPAMLIFLLRDKDGMVRMARNSTTIRVHYGNKCVYVLQQPVICGLHW